MSPEVCQLVFGARRLIRLGGGLVSAHLLVDDEGLTLVDTGLWDMPKQLGDIIRHIGRSPEELHTILLTHGHLDHTGGAAEIQEWSGAKVWLHATDLDHLAQQVRYTGPARLCDLLERAGTRLRAYRPPKIDDVLRDGERLPCWGGLRVLHAPGHTPGHCAFLSEATGLVFTGDLFASYGWSTHAPPAFLSRDPTQARLSLLRLAKTKPSAVLPSHYDHLKPELHARRLQTLANRLASRYAG